MEEEVWKDIPGYEGLYQVSNLGRAKSLERIIGENKRGRRKLFEKILKLHVSTNGYLMIHLCKDGRSICKSAHRIVANTFLKNTDNKPFINHKDGIKINNNVSNLEFVTKSENEKHAFRIGLKKSNFIGMNDKDRHRTFKKYVLQLSPDGNIIAKYRGIGEASIKTGYPTSSIGHVLRGEYAAYKGYGWKYVDKEQIKEAV